MAEAEHVDDKADRVRHPGTAYGWLAGGIVLFLGAFGVFFAMIWGGAHCQPVPQCQRSGEIHALWSMPGVVVVAGLMGFAVRWMTGRLAARLADQPDGLRVILSTVVALGSVWLLSELLPLAMIALL